MPVPGLLCVINYLLTYLLVIFKLNNQAYTN